MFSFKTGRLPDSMKYYYRCRVAFISITPGNAISITYSFVEQMLDNLCYVPEVLKCWGPFPLKSKLRIFLLSCLPSIFLFSYFSQAA